MRSTKITPEVVGKSVRTFHKVHSFNDDDESHKVHSLNDDDENHDDYRIDELEHDESGVHDIRRRSGYWQARSMFLKSYSFAADDEKGWKKMMKKKAKETNRKAKKAKQALEQMGKNALVSTRKFDLKQMGKMAMKVDFYMGAKAIVKYFVPKHP